MTQPDLKDFSDTNEINLSVIGRKSGKELSRPIWFVQEDDKLYLLPVKGSSTNWYKNVQKNPTVKITAHKLELSGKVRSITEINKVKEIIDKFRSKYGDSDVQKYYSKFDAAIEFGLN